MAEHEIARMELEPGKAGLVKVTDPLILREAAAVATPSASSPLFPVAELDDLAHRVLMAIAAGQNNEAAAENAIPLLPADEAALAEAGEAFGEGLREVLAKIQGQKSRNQALGDDDLAVIARRTELFRDDWAKAVRLENGRRAAFADAVRGSRLLLNGAGQGHLATVLRNLAEADDDLSGSFLLLHRHMVERRTGPVPGTAGGGVPFLDYSRSLVSRFPALIALRANPRTIETPPDLGPRS
jgi:hypothetical protein